MNQADTLQGRRCPHCLSVNSASSNAVHPDADRSGKPPVPGDISICLYCGGLAVFKKSMMLRRLEPAEYNALSPRLKARIEEARLLVTLVHYVHAAVGGRSDAPN